MAKVKIPAWFTKAIESDRISDEDKIVMSNAFESLVNGEYKTANFTKNADNLLLAFLWAKTPQTERFWMKIYEAIK